LAVLAERRQYSAVAVEMAVTMDNWEQLASFLAAVAVVVEKVLMVVSVRPVW